MLLMRVFLKLVLSVYVSEVAVTMNAVDAGVSKTGIVRICFRSCSNNECC